MTKSRNSAYLTFLRKKLSKKQKILDLACGYGRLAIPLAKAGYDIQGIDLSPNLIKDAKMSARKNRLKMRFLVGDMRRLPYKNESFDAVICMWSSFNHLLKQKDQVKALKEIYRTMKDFAIIDMPFYKLIKGKRLVKIRIGDIEIVGFTHDKKSLLGILKKAKIRKYKIKMEKIGDRKRLILYIYR